MILNNSKSVTQNKNLHFTVLDSRLNLSFLLQSMQTVPLVCMNVENKLLKILSLFSQNIPRANKSQITDTVYSVQMNIISYMMSFHMNSKECIYCSNLTYWQSQILVLEFGKEGIQSQELSYKKTFFVVQSRRILEEKIPVGCSESCDGL